MGVGKLFVVVAVLLGACTKANPNACCTTPEVCAAADLKVVTGCSSGRVCDPFGACVKPQCSTSADCTSADNPICIGQLCVPKCTADADCGGSSATPYCASDGVCVACKDDSQCTADKPVCDSDARTCRECLHDSECASGVCLEQEGACADASRVVFVEQTGFNSGTCTDANPCQTIAYALQQTSTARNVLRIRGITLDIPTTSFGIGSLFIDGADTIVSHSGTGSTFSVGGGNYTFEGLILTPNGSNASVNVTGGTVNLFGMKLLGPVTVSGGTTSVDGSLINSDLDCSGTASIAIHANTIYGGVNSTGCRATFTSNRFIDPPHSIAVDGAQGLVENNVILAHDEITDGMVISNSAVARFNTFVNLSGKDATASSIACNTNAVATNNIIAWHSSFQPCPGTYTLYDEIAGSRPGTGNKSANVSTFFVDLAASDFHLAAGSPAIGAADPNLTTSTDFDGSPRPSPANSVADVGAYEAP